MAAVGGAAGVAAIASVGGSLLSAVSQRQAGKAAVRESEVTAQIEELAATQRETDRKQRLATSLATANARAGAAGIAAFEGSPLTILEESIKAEEVATERDEFNTRISALVTRSRGKVARRSANIGAFTSLVKGASTAASLSGTE